MFKAIGTYLFLCFLLANTHAQNTDHNFSIEGTLVMDSIKVINGTVKLYEKNKLIKETETDHEGRFSFLLRQNKQYTLEATTPYTIVKRVQITTKSRKKLKEIKRLQMIVNLVDSDYISEQERNEYELDFPFAIIQYTEESKFFEYYIAYTDSMKQEERRAIKHIE